jgi:hypothetical protein
VNIGQDQRYQLRSDQQSLVISSANPNDDGRYVCEATNSVGNASKTFVLTLAGPPAIEPKHEEIRGNCEI